MTALWSVFCPNTCLLKGTKMRTHCQSALGFAALFIFFVTRFSHGAAWTYTGPKGVQHWSKSYPFCGGVFQSPIDLQTPLLQYDPSLVPIEVHNYDLLAHEQLTLGNSGHAVKLYLPSKMYILGLPNRYSAVELHVHWGSPNTPAGSEHTIDGKRFAAELHVVHFNSKKYSNVSVAADKSDGLAVLAVLIEVGEFNPAFDQLLKFINGVKFRDQKVQVPAFNIRHLLPLRLDQYYRYDGSLTTPPCYPSVLWTVFRNPITISHTQFLTLATAIYSSREREPIPVPLDGNYRTPQSTDQRVILVSFREEMHLWLTLGLPVSFVGASVIGFGLIFIFTRSKLRTERAKRNQERNKNIVEKPEGDHGFSEV